MLFHSFVFMCFDLFVLQLLFLFVVVSVGVVVFRCVLFYVLLLLLSVCVFCR